MNAVAAKLKKKITSRNAQVAVIGLGYVGLPMACELAGKGFKVTGIDLDQDKISQMQRGRSHITDIGSAQLKKILKRKKLKVTSDYHELSNQHDVIIICVPTPLNRLRDPDISHIISATEEVQKRLRPGALIILEKAV